MHSDKRKGRGPGRILYYFRTPPGVRVGRAALDEDAIRLIEQSNPEIEFDWTRILKGQGAEPPPEKRSTAQPPAPRSHRTAELPAKSDRPAPAPSVPATEEDVEALVDAPVTAAGAKLGAEGLSRLRGRYAEMLARIGERIPDAERQAELKTLAERLNPDAWVTEADVLAGLDGYETTFEALRSVVGRGRRSGRRRKGGRPEAAPAEARSPAPDDPEDAE